MIYSWKCGRCLCGINKLLGSRGGTANILGSDRSQIQAWEWTDSSWKCFVSLSAAGRSGMADSCSPLPFMRGCLRLFLALIPQVGKFLRKSHSRDSIHQEMLSCSAFCTPKVTQSLLHDQLSLARASSSRRANIPKYGKGLSRWLILESGF